MQYVEIRQVASADNNTLFCFARLFLFFSVTGIVWLSVKRSQEGNLSSGPFFVSVRLLVQSSKPIFLLTCSALFLFFFLASAHFLGPPSPLQKPLLRSSSEGTLSLAALPVPQERLCDATGRELMPISIPSPAPGGPPNFNSLCHAHTHPRTHT